MIGLTPLEGCIASDRVSGLGTRDSVAKAVKSGRTASVRCTGVDRHLATAWRFRLGFAAGILFFCPNFSASFRLCGWVWHSGRRIGQTLGPLRSS